MTTAAMLLLLHGQSWAAASTEITSAGLRSLGEYQRLDLNRLRSAPHQISRSPAGNPYAAARLELWWPTH